MAAPPIVCPGRYTNITATFLAEPTPPGNDSTYPVHNNMNIPTLQTDYFAFHECEVSVSMQPNVVVGGWSIYQGCYGNSINGQVRLNGFVPAQVSMGLYVGRRLNLIHTWNYTDPVTSAIYTKPFSIPVKIMKMVTGVKVQDTIRVSIESEFDYRRNQPSYSGEYIWDNTRQPGSYGYENITPSPKTNYPFMV